MELGLRVGQASDYIRRRELRKLFLLASRLVYSDSVGVGIRVELDPDQPPRPGADGLRLRKASAADLRALTESAAGEAAGAGELWQRRLRRHVADTLGPERCFVADADGIGPSFMQYLLFAEDNEAVQDLFPGLYPVLGPDEAMVEYLYVRPEARRYGLAVRGMVAVLEEARRRGARSVISFIRPDDKGAIYVCQSAGFKVASLRRSRYRFFRQTITFEPRPAHISEVPSRLLAQKPS